MNRPVTALIGHMFAEFNCSRLFSTGRGRACALTCVLFLVITVASFAGITQVRNAAKVTTLAELLNPRNPHPESIKEIRADGNRWVVALNKGDDAFEVCLDESTRHSLWQQCVNLHVPVRLYVSTCPAPVIYVCDLCLLGGFFILVTRLGEQSATCVRRYINNYGKPVVLGCGKAHS